MKRTHLAMLLTMTMLSASLFGQSTLGQSAATNASMIVPTLVKFSGSLTDANGKPFEGTIGVTFLLYKDEQGVAPLWMETQNITPDRTGHYTAVLGSTTIQGLPTDLFASGEARWLAVQAQGQAEQPRVLLLSVPYALKAGDAQTLGGMPASAFVLAASARVGVVATPTDATATSSVATAPPPASSNVTTTGGTANTIPLFTTGTNIQNSIVTQTGSGATGKIGINTTAPNATLNVNGTETVNGIFTLLSTGTATAAGGKNSQPQDFIASVFNSGTSTAVPQKFQWQAEPVSNNTAAASGQMSLLYASGTAAPAETGLKIGSKGLITFAAGQTFPGTGAGTVKSVALAAPASDFKVTGSPVTTTGTLNLAWNVVPTNASTANAIVKRDGSGSFSANTVAAATLVASQFLEVTGTEAVSGSSGGSIFQSTATASTGASIGVEGDTFSSSSGAIGVYGNASSTTCCAAMGVKGFSGNGIGIYGVDGSASSTGGAPALDGAGVWGDSGTTFSPGVLATADDKQAFIAVNNSPSGFATVFLESEDNTSSANLVFETDSPNFGGSCVIDQGGNLSCSGSVSAVAAVDGGARKVALYAVQGPESWFEDAGTGHLVNGTALIAMEPTFSQTISANPDYHVFLTPNGDCKGLYVTRKSATSFEVRELGGGTSSLDFDYRIMAKRKGLENVRLADKTQQFDRSKQRQLRHDVTRGTVTHAVITHAAVRPLESAAVSKK